MPKINDLLWLRFGKLTVIAKCHVNKYRTRNTYWVCDCDCGAVCAVAASNLARATVVSCGCHKSSQYGLTRNHPMWRRWQGMMDRCYKKTAKNYADYGGRGIRVHERWHLLANFISDMGSPPSPAHSIDRVNNNGDYSRDNCRWATPTEQARNKRKPKEGPLRKQLEEMTADNRTKR